MTDANRSFVWTCLGTAVALLAATAAINLVVDPYDIYRLTDLSLAKPGQHGQDRLLKAVGVRRAQPDTVLLGTSRTQFGLDPTDLPANSGAARAYNLGLLGSGPYLALRYLQHACANGPVHTAILGLDPLMFDLNNDEATRGFSEARLDTDATGTPRAAWQLPDIAATLFSIDALRLSLRALRAEQDTPMELLDSGLRNPRYLEAQTREHGGARGSFRLAEADYANMLGAGRWADRCGGSPKLEQLRELLAYARRQHVTLHLYISPSHARMNEVIRAVGKLAEVEAWKRQIVALIDEDARLHPDAEPLQLWDFSGASSLTGETVPQPGETATMRYYWDTADFKPSLGDKVLERLYCTDCSSDEFGKLLTTQNVDQQLQQLRQMQGWYAASHPADVQEVVQAAEQAQQSRLASARRALRDASL